MRIGTRQLSLAISSFAKQFFLPREGHDVLGSKKKAEPNTADCHQKDNQPYTDRIAKSGGGSPKGGKRAPSRILL